MASIPLLKAEDSIPIFIKSSALNRIKQDKEIMAETNYLSSVWTHLTEVQPVRGEGIYLYDEAGTRYTDFTSGIGVTNTGHCHPKVVQAVQEQAGKLIFGQMNVVKLAQAEQLAAKLNAVTRRPLTAFSSLIVELKPSKRPLSWHVRPQNDVI